MQVISKAIPGGIFRVIPVTIPENDLGECSEMSLGNILGGISEESFETISEGMPGEESMVKMLDEFRVEFLEELLEEFVKKILDKSWIPGICSEENHGERIPREILERMPGGNSKGIFEEIFGAVP